MGLGGEHHQVLNDALQVGDLPQHGELPVLRPDKGGPSASVGHQHTPPPPLPHNPPALTTTGCRKVMKVQKRPRSSMRALRTACFSVSSSSRYMSLTSCSALSSWGCRSPFPVRLGGGHHHHQAPLTFPPLPHLLPPQKKSAGGPTAKPRPPPSPHPHVPAGPMGSHPMSVPQEGPGAPSPRGGPGEGGGGRLLHHPVPIPGARDRGGHPPGGHTTAGPGVTPGCGV